MSNPNRVERRRSENRVQLLISQERNRAAVRRLLEDRYEVLTDESVVEADAYLVDDFSFPDYHAALEERVEESGPVFCPVVLIRRERTNPGSSSPTRTRTTTRFWSTRSSPRRSSANRWFDSSTRCSPGDSSPSS
ncbi:hypothetical protein ACFQMM_14460 [Saliphagus sp. GCM10025308]